MTTEPIVAAARVDGGVRAELDLVVPADLVYFDGHFPGAPVVAGVVQLKWALELGARYVGARGACVGMEALKFQQVMVPDLAVKLTLRWSALDRKLHFAFEAEGQRFGSGRLVLEAAP